MQNNATSRKDDIVVKISIVVLAIMVFFIGGGFYEYHQEHRPDWQKNPEKEASADQYYWAAQGLKDSRYGTQDSSDDGLIIIGYCAALIPDIRQALSDGKLTVLEVHNLMVKGAELKYQHDFVSEKNAARMAVGQPLLPQVDCPSVLQFSDS